MIVAVGGQFVLFGRGQAWKGSCGVSSLETTVRNGLQLSTDRELTHRAAQLLPLVTTSRPGRPLLGFLRETPVAVLAAHVARAGVLSLAPAKSHALSLERPGGPPSGFTAGGRRGCRT